MAHALIGMGVPNGNGALPWPCRDGSIGRFSQLGLLSWIGWLGQINGLNRLAQRLSLQTASSASCGNVAAEMALVQASLRRDSLYCHRLSSYH